MENILQFLLVTLTGGWNWILSSLKRHITKSYIKNARTTYCRFKLLYKLFFFFFDWKVLEKRTKTKLFFHRQVKYEFISNLNWIVSYGSTNQILCFYLHEMYLLRVGGIQESKITKKKYLLIFFRKYLLIYLKTVFLFFLKINFYHKIIFFK